MRNKLYIGAILFFCGSAMGSFLNCICDRMIRKENILGRSRCPECSCVLEAIDLVPVISYLLLKGRCRRCGNKIDPFCFISEILGGLIVKPAGKPTLVPASDKRPAITNAKIDFNEIQED